jgi:hypothetical protein
MIISSFRLIHLYDDYYDDAFIYLSVACMCVCFVFGVSDDDVDVPTDD